MLYTLEELALCGTGVADNAAVDVASDVGLLNRLLVHAAEPALFVFGTFCKHARRDLCVCLRLPVCLSVGVCVCARKREELALCGTGVADNAAVDVASDVGLLNRLLVHTAEPVILCLRGHFVRRKTRRSGVLMHGSECASSEREP